MGDAEDFACGESVNVDVFFKGAHQQGIGAEVGEQAEFDLGVIRGKKFCPGRGSEGCADFAAELGANGDVLAGLGLTEESLPVDCGCGLECCVHARVSVGQERQRVNVIRLELGEMTVLEDEAGNFVLLGKLFKHVLRCGDGLAFAADNRSWQAHVREEKGLRRVAFGELILNRRPASSKMRSPTRSSSRLKRDESDPRAAVSMRTPSFSMR